MSDVKDVIVIGGGISGLSAALLLEEQGLNVVVLEARDRVGGRTLTVRDPSYGGYTDVGGAYVGSTQRRVARLADRFGLKFHKVSVEQKNVMSISKKWCTYEGSVPPIYNPIIAMDLNNLIRTVEALSKQVPAEAPWRAEKAEMWDKMTAKELVNEICWTEFSRNSVAIECRALLGSEPHEVSALAFLWYVSSGQGFKRMVNVTNGAQERKFVGGAQQLSESMADVLGDRVRLSSPVVRVDDSEDIIKVSSSC